ncbi:MAG: Heavy metal efflux outer membrane protein CzcC family [Myxococcales bacterium]|nr:Heavy metal efflux outer membrane protein CzcC family [Myxococcales bacterium]
MFLVSFLSKRSIILAGALGVLGITPAAAVAHERQTAPERAGQSGRTLTIDEALQIANKNNRDLQQAKARVDQAHAAVLQAWSALLPTANAQGKYTHNYKEVAIGFPGLTDPIVIQKGEQLDFGLTALVPLIVPWGYPSVQAAKRNEEAGRANQAVTTAQVLYSAAQAYYACAGADELVEARKHAVVVAQKALDNARARLEAGVVNRVEVKRAELQLVRAQQALVESEDTAAATYRALGTVLNMHDPVRVIAGDVSPAQPEPVETLTANALTLRPEFTAIRKTIEGNRLVVTSNWLRWVPTVSAFGNLRAFNYGGFAGDNYSWAVGLQADWLLYDAGIRDSSRVLAAAQRRENEARLDLLKDQVRDDVYNADRQLGTKRRALETAKRSVQLSKETLDLVQVQHDAGTATQLDLLQAQDALVGSEVALAQAHFDLSLGALSLERLSGAFPGNRNFK